MACLNTVAARAIHERCLRGALQYLPVCLDDMENMKVCGWDHPKHELGGKHATRCTKHTKQLTAVHQPRYTSDKFMTIAAAMAVLS